MAESAFVLIMTASCVSPLHRVLCFNLFMPAEPKTACFLCVFGNISLTKAIFRKYLKENCGLKYNPHLFFNFSFNLQVISKLF